MSENVGGKKGLHPMAWVGIGCGVFVLIGIVAVVLVISWGARKVKEVAQDFEANPERAAAEMVVKFNPEMEMVSADDTAGTMTIRMKDTGEEVTLDYQDIAEGKFTVTTDEGTTTVNGREGVVNTTNTAGETTSIGGGGGIEKMPKWFDIPEGLTGWQVLMHSERAGKVSVIVKAEATKPFAEIGEALKKNLEAKGFEEMGNVTSGPATSVGYAHKGEGKNVNVSMASERGKDYVMFTMTES
jgi:hypothetical protein